MLDLIECFPKISGSVGTCPCPIMRTAYCKYFYIRDVYSLMVYTHAHTLTHTHTDTDTDTHAVNM